MVSGSIRRMRVIAITIVVFLLSSSLSRGFPAPEIKVFDIKSDPDFRNYKRILTEFVRARRSRVGNDFCVLGYVTSDNLKSAWVIWRQGREIILWEGQDGDLALSRRVINLKSDVVPTDGDVHGSTYLVTKAWVERITTTCDHSGVKVHMGRIRVPNQH